MPNILQSFKEFRKSALDFIDNYRLIPFQEKNNVNHTNRATVFYAVLRKLGKPLRMASDEIIPDPTIKEVYKVFENIRDGDISSDYLAKVQVPLVTLEGEQGASYNFVTGASGSGGRIFRQNKERKINESLMDFSEIFSPIETDVFDDNSVYLIIKGITEVSYHFGIEDDNSAAITIPNIRNMLYDGYGRNIITPGDEIFLYGYDNYTAKVSKIFKGIITSLDDRFDGTYYSLGLTLSDFTWVLRNLQFLISPGNSNIERIFGYSTGTSLRDLVTKSQFMDNGKPNSKICTYTFYDWKDPVVADKVPLQVQTSFGGLDLASAISLILAGQNYYKYLIGELILDVSDIEAQSYYAADVDNIVSSKYATSELAQTLLAKSTAATKYIDSLADSGGEIKKGMGFLLASNFRYTFAGRNTDLLKGFNKRFNESYNKTQIPSSGSTLEDLIKETFNNDLQAHLDYITQYKTSANPKGFLNNRFSENYLIIEPEIAQSTGYILAFDNFKDVWESEYTDIFSFFKNMSDQAGLVFYSDNNGDYRLETIHCNDFPSAIIDSKDIQSWGFSEDITGYVTRMDVNTNSINSYQNEAADIDRLRWAMTLDFNLLQRYGYKAEERTFVAGEELNFSNGMALSVIMSRRFMDLQNGRIFGGDITVHPIRGLKLNSTVYIKPRNMIYTVMAIDDSISNEGAGRSVTIKLGFGRSPATFYEGLLYGFDTEFSEYTQAESLRVNTIKLVRDEEYYLWVRDKETYSLVRKNALHANTVKFTDAKLKEFVSTDSYKTGVTQGAKRVQSNSEGEN